MRAYSICLALIVAGILCVPFDVQLAAWFIDDGLPGDIRALFQRVEAFGHTYGLICIAVTIYLLDPARRHRLPQVVMTFAIAGLTADLIKLMVWRLRPRAYFELIDSGTTFVGSIWTHFDQAATTMTDHAFHSFPSAHTACAVAFAFQLSRLYPTGRNWFYILALLCAMNRIDGGAHYASDVCWGAAVGYAVSRVLVDVQWSPPEFARRLSGRQVIEANGAS